MLVLKLGWRNLWRNTRRSLITIAAVATAFFFLILLVGMTMGLKDQLLANGTNLMLGHVQLHNPDYLPDRGLYDTLGGRQGVDPDLSSQIEEKFTAVKAAAPRVYGFALLSTGEHSAGAQLIGVDPEREARVTTFLNTLHTGQPLAAQAQGGILLGEGLAEELRAQIGGEVAALTQAADGSLGNALFAVRGILRSGLSHVDKTLAVVHVSDLQDLLVLPPQRIHEIVLSLDDPMQADALTEQLNADSELPEQVEAASWGDLSPQLRDYLAMFESSYGFIIGLIAIFAALGILNTMLMAVFERSREIGTVTSLGMLPEQVLFSILAESFFLSLIGVAAGLGIGGWAMNYLSTSGLDLSRWMGEMAIMSTRMDPVIRFQWNWEMTSWAGLTLMAASILAAAIPAFRAARMDPVKAMAAAKGV
ncbi:MAG TPA: FtsX-like permease family protein [Acidobacteriota bacterium]|nr:FtsX-like permease family protein [Acidobacteriota bacterium]